MQGAPGADEILHPMAVAMVEMPPGIHVPGPQREQGQQVVPRLVVWCSEPRGAQGNEAT